MAIDPHSFGGTKASETLAFLLNTKYPTLVRKVGSYYHQYNSDLADMSTSWWHYKDGGLIELMVLHRDKKFSVVENSTLPTELKSFLLNVMSVSFAKRLSDVKTLIKTRKLFKIK